MPIQNCLECKKEFHVPINLAKIGKGIYCSRECYTKARKSHKYTLSNAHRWKGGKIKLDCEICGKKFEVYPYRVKKGPVKYCSRKCASEAHSKLFVGEKHPNYKEKVQKVCKICGKVFEVKPSLDKASRSKYCSKECYGKASSLFYIGERARNWRGGLVKRVCKYCKKEFEIKPSHVKGGEGTYCSRDCKETDQLAEKHPSWKGGISFEPYCPKFNNKFRERVRKWFDYQCVECGQPQNERKLQIHHVYYNKKACCEQNENGEYIYNIDNEPFKVVGNPNKFVALCNSCHIKTNSKRLFWARYFEDIINNWYQGQSWTD